MVTIKGFACPSPSSSFFLPSLTTSLNHAMLLLAMMEVVYLRKEGRKEDGRRKDGRGEEKKGERGRGGCNQL